MCTQGAARLELSRQARDLHMPFAFTSFSVVNRTQGAGDVVLQECMSAMKGLSLSASSIIFHGRDTHDSCSTRSPTATKKQVNAMGRNPNHDRNVDVFGIGSARGKKGKQVTTVAVECPMNPFGSLGTLTMVVAP